MDKKNDGAVYALLNIPQRETETAEVEVKRLKLKITLRELSFDKLKSLRSEKDSEVSYLLASIVTPNVRDSSWFRDYMGCPTPADALKRLLKPGEITQLIRHADVLNGYGLDAVAAIGMEDDQIQAQAVDHALEDLEKN